MKACCWICAILILGLACIPARVLAQRSPTAQPARTFALVAASPAIATCLPGLSAHGIVIPNDQNDTLTLHASGLPGFAAFDLYITARPHAPFGAAWPLGLLQADAQGVANVQVQTALLRASAIAEVPVPASQLVLFFDNPRDADPCFGAGGAPSTPYNSVAHAGPAVLATLGYPDAAGPLLAPALPPPGLGVNAPLSGHSAVRQAVTFTSSCSDPAGWKAIRFIDFRLSQGGVIRFWARLDRPAKRMYLYDPTTRRWIGGLTPGSPGALIQPLTQLIVTDSGVAGTAGTTGAVTWRVAFSAAARGQRFEQSVALTDLRDQTSGWNPTGTWNVD